MNTQEPTFEIFVDGMTCEHCRKAVTKAVSSLPEVTSVEVDLATGKVSGTGSVSLPDLRTVIEEEGYSIKS